MGGVSTDGRARLTCPARTVLPLRYRLKPAAPLSCALPISTDVPIDSVYVEVFDDLDQVLDLVNTITQRGWTE